MIGAIVGDIVGSVYEFHNIKTKQFPLFSKTGFFTDDTIMTLAIAQALMDVGRGGRSDEYRKAATTRMQELGREYRDGGYGGMFAKWVDSPRPKPYNSFGNGSAMRISAVGWLAKTESELRRVCRAVTDVTHSHPEGIKGAEAVAMMIFKARRGASKADLLDEFKSRYYDYDFTLNDIRETYRFNETCQKTVPQAFEAFYESRDFEDSIRNAISIGGDSDTLSAITGSIAEAYYGVPKDIEEIALSYLDDRLMSIFTSWRSFIK